MISTFQQNWYFKKVSLNKTLTHVQEQKKAMSPRHSAYIPSRVKLPLEKPYSGQKAIKQQSRHAGALNIL